MEICYIIIRYCKVTLILEFSVIIKYVIVKKSSYAYF